jgi:hypothetical protein
MAGNVMLAEAAITHKRRFAFGMTSEILWALDLGFALLGVVRAVGSDLSCAAPAGRLPAPPRPRLSSPPTNLVVEAGMILPP